MTGAARSIGLRIEKQCRNTYFPKQQIDLDTLRAHIELTDSKTKAAAIDALRVYFNKTLKVPLGPTEKLVLFSIKRLFK